MNIQVSFGDFVDKLTILEIKMERMTDPSKIKNVRNEYQYLKSISEGLDPSLIQSQEYLLLKQSNEIIWDGENEFRRKERLGEFDSEFIDTVRTIHSTNDKRAEIKRGLNLKYNSLFIEEKEHQA